MSAGPVYRAPVYLWLLSEASRLSELTLDPEDDGLHETIAVFMLRDNAKATAEEQIRQEWGKPLKAQWEESDHESKWLCRERYKEFKVTRIELRP